MKKLYFLLIGTFFILSLTTAYSQCNADFQITPSSGSGCEVLTVKFTDQSTGLIVNRVWNFGDGTPTTGAQNPVHNYETGKTESTYSAYLAIECTDGTKDTMYTDITVYPRPEANFTLNRNELCAITDTLSMTNLSPELPGSSYFWEFGDFQSSTDKNPDHVYFSNGALDVTLTVTNNNGCQEKLTKPVLVKETPNPDFTVVPFSGCVPLTVSFTNLTPDTKLPVTSWTWDFGNGTTSSLKNPENQFFTESDTFFVKLTAVNTSGCSNYSTKPVLVSDSTEIELSYPTVACPKKKIQITANAKTSDPAIYSWEVDDGIISGPKDQPTIEVEWPGGGIKEITSTVRVNGCDNINSFYIDVSPVVEVEAFYSTGSPKICKGDDITIYAYPAGFEEYVWNSQGQQIHKGPDHSFTLINLQKDTGIVITAIDSYGCWFHQPAEITAISPPSVSVSTPEVCEDSPATFIASPDGYDDYEFYLNHVSVQSGLSNTFTIDSLSENDQVEVKVTTGSCSQTSDPNSAQVKDSLKTPVINCGESDPNSLTVFWEPLGNEVAYEISINGGSFQTPSTGTNGLSHSISGLAEDSAVTFAMKGSSGEPCNHVVITETITCFAVGCNGPDFTLDYPESTCNNEPITITIQDLTNITGPYSFKWEYEETTEINTSLSFEIPEFKGGYATIKLTDSGSVCQPVKKIAEPDVKKTVTLEATATKACSNSSTEIRIKPGNLESYIYKDQEGNILQESNKPVLELADTSVTKVTISTSSDDICNSPETTVEIDWITVPEIPLSGSGPDTICEGTNVTHTVEPGIYTSYHFYNGPKLIDETSSNSINLDNLKPGNTIWAVGLMEGCVSDSSEPVSYTVLPKPSINIAASKNAICSGESIVFQASPDVYDTYTFFYYNQNKPHNLIQDGPSAYMVLRNISETDTIGVTVTNGSKCSATEAVSFVVENLTVSSAVYPIGDSAFIHVKPHGNLSPPSYEWTTGETRSYIFVEIESFESAGVTVETDLCTRTIGFKQEDILLIDNCKDTCFSACINQEIKLNPCSFWGQTLLYYSDDRVDTSNYSFTPKQAGYYEIHATSCYDEIGCITRTFKVSICNCDTSEAYVPNAITPNNDGKNDVWIISNARRAEVKVFNRWGDLIIEDNDYQNDWKGTDKNNNPLADGMYFYYAKIYDKHIKPGICSCPEKDITKEFNENFLIQR